MAFLPRALLKRLYVKGSMKLEHGYLSFKLKNSLATASLNAPVKVKVDDAEVKPEEVVIVVSGRTLKSSEISEANPVEVPVGTEVEVRVPGSYAPGKHKVALEISVKGYGRGSFEVEDEAK